MLKIIKIANTGDFKTEYVHLQAVADCDIGDFIVTDSTFGPADAPSNKLRHVYFFEPTVVKAGDFVVLWTRKEKASSQKHDSGVQQHNRFWGLQEHIWNVTGDSAVLLAAPLRQRTKLDVGARK